MINEKLDIINYHLDEIEKCINSIEGQFKEFDDMPPFLQFIVLHAKDNVLPGFKGFLWQTKTMNTLHEKAIENLHEGKS